MREGTREREREREREYDDVKTSIKNIKISSLSCLASKHDVETFIEGMYSGLVVKAIKLHEM